MRWLVLAIFQFVFAISWTQEYYGNGWSPVGLSHEQIDTLWILPPSFRIGKIDDNGLRDHSVELSEMASDSMVTALLNYFSDTDVQAVKDKFVRYSIPARSGQFDSIKTKEIKDSIVKFYHQVLIKHTSKKKEVQVPEFFFQIMEDRNMDFALMTFCEGFSKTKKQYNRALAQEIITYIIVSGITGVPVSGPYASQFESNITLLLLDRKTRKVAFIGRSYYPVPPFSEEGLHFQVHSMFDSFLDVPLPVNKKMN
jgi:hypothetical protein